MISSAMLFCLLSALCLYAKMTDAAAEEFVFVKGGTFLMGSPAEEPERGQDEVRHQVTVGNFHHWKHHHGRTGQFPQSLRLQQ
ncbi:MAG: hypothetical protein LBT97_06530 [Planctomycetota bacterium]|jgi:formylglycine-generating enzyme required for sulfatase activity|nr:hypothetical protein [Planctomycetota bacterium]